jgi:hypothetical protein
MIKYIVSFSIVIVVFIIFFLPDYLISNFQGTGNNALYLLHNDVLAGTLILPPGKLSPPFVLLVHGDGPQDRWSEGGYIPLVKFLVSQE